MHTTLDRTPTADTLTLNVKRVIKAKRQLVFDAWTKPEMLTKWFGCGDEPVATAEVDLRIGGSYSIAMGDCAKGETHCASTLTGTYTEIVANERLCFTWVRQGDPTPETLVTVEFRDVADGTEITIRHERFEDRDICAQHENGWYGCLDNLERFVAQRS